MSAPGIGFPEHEISIELGGEKVVGWETYEIEVSMLDPTDRFRIRMPFSREAWDLCKPDHTVRVLIDDVVVMNGFIDERLVPEDDEAVEIVGRDRAGRLVDESAPSLNFSGLEMFELIKRVAAPWFTAVSFSNARNRNVLRGKGKRARAAGEPVVLKTRKAIGTRIEPGQTRWQVIEDLCTQAGYLAWSSGDGTELIVGKPNYDQELQFKFFKPKADSTRGDESTVIGMGTREAVTQRYSRIIVVGSGIGTDVNYGSTVASRYGEALDNPASKEGDGVDFSQPKRLIAVRPVNSIKEAQELADREMAKRDAHGTMVTVLAPGHGQVIAGAYTTIFAPDNLALVEDERIGLKGSFMIVSCTYRGHRDAGEQTSMTLVRSGAELIS